MNLQEILEAAIKNPQPAKLAEVISLADRELEPYKHKKSNYRAHMESLLATLKEECAKVKVAKPTGVSNFFSK